ncbi:LLM class F420-dependent oxidoreductase [SAR202 cluster bacterium AD-804-J14_MRT_500m]|nr:LLM class F420-dependent oxidoreductase [SAR202 cluster bacterium AD-804-J14_MRT_500m]
MKLGVVFPQTEIGPHPKPVRAYSQAVEALGYDHILAFEQVIGPSQAHHSSLNATYWQHHMFHEPLTLFGFLAGITQKVELATGVIVLPMRQTALVAKQSVEVDLLSGGRLRLGIGVGIKPPEFEALGQDYGDRGHRCEEQVKLLRQLWANATVDVDWRWHKITQAGINPVAIKKSIPIWFGGTSDAAMERTARSGDGWIPHNTSQKSFFLKDGSAQEVIKQFHQLIYNAGREPKDLGIEVWIDASRGTETKAAEQAGLWQEIGITHLSINTMNAGLKHVEEHVEVLGMVKNEIG